MKSGLFVKKGLSIILLFPVVCGHNAAAIEAGSEDLLSMDIESLMKIKVYSTTKTQLDINKSPGIVRVFSQHDFERFGFKTLKDVMTAVPGIQLAHS